MAGRRFDVTISAPGAKEIRVRQVNNGGDTFLKSAPGQKLTFKTNKMQKGRSVSVARIKIRVFWKNNEGGGDEWFGPRSVGSSQTIELRSPVARGAVAAPQQPPPSQPSQQPGSGAPTAQQGGWNTSWAPDGSGTPPVTVPSVIPSYDTTPESSYTTPGGGYVPEQGGYSQTQESGGGWGWGWAAAGLGSLLAATAGVVIIKKRRDRAA